MLRRLHLVFAAGALAAVSAPAPLSRADPLPESRTSQSKPKHKARTNSCAVYGPGYVQAAGGTTCVKIGGKVEFEIGVRPGRDTFRTR
ncbi:MAG: hypothetical protein AB7F96_17695 [Beijerinckiaceae bacterium]